MTAEPLWRTTTTCFCTSRTFSTSSFWQFGRFICFLSYPSDSKLSGSPRKRTATSASAATFTAFIWSSSITSSFSSWYPSAKVTFASSGISFAASSADSTFQLLMWELPPPWYLGVFAYFPINAIFLSEVNGRMSFSFFNNTIHSASISAAALWSFS